MLEILVSTLWTCFVLYGAWYFTLAKHYAPLSFMEARLLWRLHRLDVKCNARKWREIRKGNKIVGFQCECGYKHIQRRPIVATKPAAKTQTQTPMFDRLHNLYR
jgi:hypothetical protein